METKIQIPATNNCMIYGMLTQATADRAEKLIIHIHGLTHNQSSYLSVNAAAFFPALGFDHFRFSFYERNQDSRKLPDTTLSTQVEDLRTIMNYFQEKYEKIYLIGHSLGGLTAAILNPDNIAAISLWDPAFDVMTYWKSIGALEHVAEQNYYLLDYGVVFVLGAAMIEEIEQHTNEKCLKLAEKISTPVQMIIPEESIFKASPHTSPEQYISAFTAPSELIHLPKANHTFTYENNCLNLLSYTREWFDKF